MTEDQVRQMLRVAAGPYATRKNSSGINAFCADHGINKGHASEFMNGKRGPGSDLLAALGLERTYSRIAREALRERG